MARLPDVQVMGDRPIPRGAGPVSISIPEQAGFQSLGQGLTAVGESLLKIKEHDDSLRAEDAYNKLLQQKIDMTSGGSGFGNLKSGDVATQPVFKTYMDKFNQAVDNIAGGLDDGNQRAMFKRRAEVAQLQFGNDLTNHIQREKQVYAKQVYDGGKAIELQNAAAHWNEPSAIALSLERTSRLIDQQATSEGWPADIKKAAKLAAASDVHTSVIAQAIATDNPDYAKTYYEKNKEQIDSTKYPELEKLIKDGGIKVTAQNFTDDVVSRNLDEATALAEARKKFQGAEENAVVSMVRDRYAEQRRVEEDNQKAASDQAWNIYAETRDFSKVPTTILQQMDGKAREGLRAYADQITRGKAPQTDYGVYYKLVQLAKENPPAFKQLNLMDYMPYLSDSHRDELIGLQTKPQEISYVSTKTDMMAQGALAAGLNPKEKNKESDSGKELADFYNKINLKYESYQVLNGKKPDDKKLKEIIDETTIHYILDKKVNLEHLFGLFTTERSFSSLTKEEKENSYVTINGKEFRLNEIPSQERDFIIQKMTQYGIPITEQGIVEAYVQKHGMK